MRAVFTVLYALAQDAGEHVGVDRIGRVEHRVRPSIQSFDDG